MAGGWGTPGKPTVEELRVRVSEDGVLVLNNSGIEELPENIGELKGLRVLFLGGNQLTSLPESIGELKELRELYFNDNQLTALPGSIGELKELRELNLHDNQLTTLPGSIGELKGLKELSLGDNQLTTLPESIGELKELWELHLFDNQLTTLPSGVYRLPHLSRLELRGNAITELPEDVGGGPRLRNIHADWHRLTSPAIPAHVRQHGGDAVRSFIRARHFEQQLSRDTPFVTIGEEEMVIRVHDDPASELRAALEEHMPPSARSLQHVVVLAHGVRRHDLDMLQALCKLLVPFTSGFNSAYLEHHNGKRVLAGRAQIARMVQTDAPRTQVLLIGEARAGKTTLSMRLQRQPHGECTAPKPRTRGVVHHEAIQLYRMEGFAFLVEFGGQHEYRHLVPLFVGGSTLHVVVVRTQHEDGSDRSFEAMAAEVEEFLHLTALRHTSNERVLEHVNTLFPAEDGAAPVTDADVWNDPPAVMLMLNGRVTDAAQRVVAEFGDAAEGTYTWQQCVRVVHAVFDDLHAKHGGIEARRTIPAAVRDLEQHHAQRATLQHDVLAVRRAVETIAARDMADRIVGDDEHRAAPFMRWADLRTKLRAEGCDLSDARLRACMWALYQNTEVLARRCDDCTWVCLAPQWLFDAVAICIPHDNRGDVQRDGALSGRAQLVAELAARVHVADDGMTLRAGEEDAVLRDALHWLVVWGFAARVGKDSVHVAVPLRAAHAPPPAVHHVPPVAQRVITFTHTSMPSAAATLLRVPGYLERTVALVFQHFVSLGYDVRCSGRSLVMHGAELADVTVELSEPDASSRELVLRVSSRSQGDAALDGVRHVLREMLRHLDDVWQGELWALKMRAEPLVEPLPLKAVWKRRGEAGDASLDVLGDRWRYRLFAMMLEAPDTLFAGPHATAPQRALRVLGMTDGMLRVVPQGAAEHAEAPRVWAVTMLGAVHELQGRAADDGWRFAVGGVRPHALVVCGQYGVHAQHMPPGAVREVRPGPGGTGSGEHAPADDVGGVLRVVFLCDEWLSAKGGVSTINRMVVDALLEQGDVAVACLLPKSAEGVPEDKGKYARVFTRMAMAPGERFETALLTQHIAAPPRADRNLIVVGHMGVTSKAAAWLAKLWGARHAHFVHVLPEWVALFKDGREWGSGEASKEAAVAQLKASTGRWDAASFVVGVGPRLAREWMKIVRTLKIPMTRFDPWLPREEPLEALPPADLPEGHLMLRGRMQHLRQKGSLLLLEALDKVAGENRAVKQKLRRAGLVLRGVQEHEWNDVVKLHTWTHFTAVLPRPFTTRAERLEDDLHPAQLVLMPSRSEGFGLVALEALAAGRAVLVSFDSGFAELLSEDEDMAALSECCAVEMPPDDGMCVNNLAAWLRKYFTDEAFRTKVHENTAALRARYAEVVVREEQIARFVRAINAM